MKVMVHIARTILGLVFAVFGLNGFLGFMPAVLPSGLAGQFLEALLRSHFVLYVSAVMIIGGILLVVNRFVILGMCFLGPVLVNILIFHLTMAPSEIGVGLVLSIIWLFLFWRYRLLFAVLFEPQVREL